MSGAHSPRVLARVVDWHRALKMKIPCLMQDTLDSLMQTKVDNDLILSESNQTCPGTLVAVEER